MAPSLRPPAQGVAEPSAHRPWPRPPAAPSPACLRDRRPEPRSHTQARSASRSSTTTPRGARRRALSPAAPAPRPCRARAAPHTRLTACAPIRLAAQHVEGGAHDQAGAARGAGAARRRQQRRPRAGSSAPPRATASAAAWRREGGRSPIADALAAARVVVPLRLSVSPRPQEEAYRVYKDDQAEYKRRVQMQVARTRQLVAC